MAIRDCIELSFEENPSRLLGELGLQTKQFKRTKENILTRLMAHPEFAMIVLEFRREGLFYGEVQFGQSDNYTETRKSRSEAIGRAARRDQDRPEEPTVNGNDGIPDCTDDESGWGLESLLRAQIARRGSQRETEANGWS